MLPMIAVSGTRARRSNSMWARAAAPSQWWQNPTLSFGPGYEQWVPSSSVPVDYPPIQANPRRAARAPIGDVAWSQVVRSGCYKSGGGCKSGFRKVGYDKDGSAICCPSMSGPLVRNPETLQTCLYLCGETGTAGRAKCRQNCFHIHAPPKKGAGSWVVPGSTLRPKPKCPSGTHRCGSFCCKNLSATDDARRGRMRSSSKRRMQVRAVARAARSMVTVGHSHHGDHEPDWKTAGSCCESCHHGGTCEGGCGDNCNCGKEGPAANVVSTRRILFKPSRNPTFSPTPTMRMRPALNPSTMQVGDMVFSPPTTSRLLNRARARISRARRGSGLVTRPGVPVPLGRPETLADCLYLCDKNDAKCRQDCFHKHRPPRTASPQRGRLTAAVGTRGCPPGWTPGGEGHEGECCWRFSKYMPWLCRPEK